ncbi:YsnF/AvaK domain-containing protein [Cesiribacter sp. SM1]|uniref:YsnF/AvaK domain-containing protein n=1 Tax=Cesiribacter sp. SM1 TaxID=2861196 RepID=UPI001CD322C2|nr:YsnF/AvaK domain-containing protein [Cesiribacter sp. SM1]
MSKSQTVIGIFENKVQAQKAADQLVTDGFDRGTIDLSAHGTDIKDNTAHDRTDTFFTNLLGRDPHVTNYREAARRGTVVTVHTDEMANAERAAAILDKFGAINVADAAKAKGTTGTATATTADADVKGKSIPVIEENVQVGKREVETGEVRVHSRIVERPVEEKLRLREEHVNVERHPVDRPASKRDFDTFQEGDARITEHAEQPMIKKEARVVEEVNIGKETTSHTEKVRDTERRTDVEVDRVSADKDRNRTS